MYLRRKLIYGHKIDLFRRIIQNIDMLTLLLAGTSLKSKDRWWKKTASYLSLGSKLLSSVA